MRKLFPVAIVLVLAALGLAACGGSSSSDSTSSETTAKKESAASPKVSEVKIEAAKSGLAFASDTASVEGGEVVVAFFNPQSVPHNVALENEAGEVVQEGETVTDQTTTTTNPDLKPGKYTFFCTIPGHREAGMEGTLTVK